jgi:hypothetical protein
MKKLITKIVMRTGNEYTIDRDLGDAAKQRIGQSTGSVFLNIPNLGAMINSADITEILDEVEEVAQTENLLDASEWTPEDQAKRLEIIKKTRVQLEARGVL